MEIYIPVSKSEGLYKEKGSKFIAYLFPVVSDENIKNRMQEVRAEHSKARHHCYAYRLGPNGDIERANDDGEPSGSAGLPILNQIKSEELTNTLVIVVRYFGGTKLGVSGLIRAYKEATKMAASQIRKSKYIEKEFVEVEFPIGILGDVERIMARHGLTAEEASYDNLCRFRIEVISKEKEGLLADFTALKDLNLMN